MKKLKLTATFAGVVATALLLTGCATRPNYNELVLYYKAGIGDNKDFVECINPGGSGKYPIDDQTFTIATDIRTWNIRHEGGDTDKAIETGTKYGPDGQPGPQVKTYATSDFYINTDCSNAHYNDDGSNQADWKANSPDSPVVKFWQNLGHRYEISADGQPFNKEKFRGLLLNTLVPVEEKSLADGTRFYTADELVSNQGSVRSQMEQQIAPLFQKELLAKLGGNFFCGTGFTRNPDGTIATVEWDELVFDGTNDATTGKPNIKTVHKKGKCPPVRISITDIDFSNQAIADARAKVTVAENEAKAKLIAAQAELDQAKILGQAATNEAYIRYKQVQAQLAAAEACKANPNCTVIIDGTGGNVNVNAGSGK